MFRVKYKTSKKVTCSHCGCSVLVLNKVEFLGYAYCSEECAWADFSAKLTMADLMGIIRKMKSLEDNAGALAKLYLSYRQILWEAQDKLEKKLRDVETSYVTKEKYEDLYSSYCRASNRSSDAEEELSTALDMMKIMLSFAETARYIYEMEAIEKHSYGGGKIYEVTLLFEGEHGDKYGVRVYEGNSKAKVDKYFEMLDKAEQMLEEEKRRG